MKSVALIHFPQVVLSENRFQLFNPVLKKRYKNRPEERVRLRWAEYLLHQSQVKRSRIGFETPVHLRRKEQALRADLVIYDQNFEPDMLVECKAEQVRLSGKTAQQAARYNSKIKAPHLILTNGVEDFRFEYQNGTIQENSTPLPGSNPDHMISRNVIYWSERGFCAPNPSGGIGPALAGILDDFWNPEHASRFRYLDFKKSPLPVPMNHYYRIFEFEEERKLAVTFSGHEEKGIYLIAVCNSGGKNDGLFSLNLEGFPIRNSPVLMTKEGSSKFHPDALDLFGFEKDGVFMSEKFAEALIRFFD